MLGRKEGLDSLEGSRMSKSGSEHVPAEGWMVKIGRDACLIRAEGC